MSKEENPPPGGLLSKVVRFVKNPTVNWSELDQPESERDSAYSRQLLKEMIERKRRNDFVRRREFDHLRKLRRRGAVAPPSEQDGEGGRPSFFQSSLASRPTDDRAVTLKKIDEIEAQMSMQWWRTKGAPPGAAAVAGSAAAPSAAGPVAPTAPTAPIGLSTVALGDIGGYASTVAADVNLSRLSDSAPLFPAGGRASAFVPNPRDTALNTLPQQQAEGFRHDPQFEDAAIFFANGDFRGAEASLLSVRDQRQGEEQAEAWLVLFDLYRAAGWHESFEGAAIDYAARFGRSAPLWFSLPDLLGEAPLPAPADAAAPQGGFAWLSPPLLTVATVATLEAAPPADGPLLLNWEALESIEPAALQPLVRLFGRWLDTPGLELHFHGAARLESLLRDRTPSHDRSVDVHWWTLRLELLRLLSQPEAFDLVALDYCITYEVSPPPWQPPRCRFERADHLPLEVLSTMPADLVPSGTGDIDLLSLPAGQIVPAGPLPALAGHLVGDAGAALEPVDAALGQQGGRQVDCGRLARVDFTAAGTILNWAAAHEAEGRRLQFTQVQRLVAVFLNVIGINEHALILARKD